MDKVAKIIQIFVTEILNPIIVILISLSVVYFFWGMMVFILNSDDETKRTEAKSHIFWSIIGFVIIFGVWGILNFVVFSIYDLTNPTSVSAAEA